jgi:hypothetical protein
VPHITLIKKKPANSVSQHVLEKIMKNFKLQKLVDSNMWKVLRKLKQRGCDHNTFVKIRESSTLNFFIHFFGFCKIQKKPSLIYMIVIKKHIPD